MNNTAAPKGGFEPFVQNAAMGLEGRFQLEGFNSIKL
mgnify:FL=1